MYSNYSYDRTKEAARKIPVVPENQIKAAVEQIRHKIDGISGVKRVSPNDLGFGWDSESGFSLEFSIRLDGLDLDVDDESYTRRRYPYPNDAYALYEDPEGISENVTKTILAGLGLSSNEATIKIENPEHRVEPIYSAWSIEDEKEFWIGNTIEVAVDVQFDT